MKLKRIFRMLAALLCVASLPLGAAAVQVDSDAVYCFSSGDFSEEENLVGICITDLPEASTGTVMLGRRVLQSGDVLTVQQMERMTFHPVQSETDLQAMMTYLPVYQDRVDSVATMSIEVLGKRDLAPVAEDSAMETYKNLPNEALLKVKDPEGQKLIFTVTRQPRRGDVVIREDGSFHYTPKKNKVGIDSFTYTATDPAGNVSREATVTITITKPTDAAQYTDTAGESCRFAAEWMKNTGIFVSEAISGNNCFRPDKDVSQGEFLTMLVGVLDMKLEETTSYTAMSEDTPIWLKPYLAAAMRSGLLAGLPDGAAFAADEPVTGAAAAVMVQNALKLCSERVAVDAVSEDVSTDWATYALRILTEHGIELDARQVLSRGDAAQVIYQISLLAPEAPGTAVLRVAQ